MLFDAAYHQGLGLNEFSAQRPLRLITVISQPKPTIALEALWHVCASLQDMGYPVVVLDATAQEGPQAPGLLQALERGVLHGTRSSVDGAGAAPQADFPIVPAALGLQALCQQGHTSSVLRQLAPLLSHFAAVVLYVPSALAVPLLYDYEARPLVLSTPDAAGLLNSYQRLKELALLSAENSLAAHSPQTLQCTVAAIQPPGVAEDGPEVQAMHTLFDKLRLQAQRMLHMPTQTTYLWADRPHDLQRLALQLLENACNIGTTMTMLHAPRPSPFAATHERSY